LRGQMTPPYPLGKQSVIVTNPGPGGGPSGAASLEITGLAPTIVGVSRTTLGLGEAIQVTGTNYGLGSMMLLRGQPIPTLVLSSTDLVSNIPVTTTTGAADLMVRNPGTTLQVPLDSNVVTIQLVYPMPVITSLTPSSAQGGASITVG